MKIVRSIGKKTTTLRWLVSGDKISVRFPGRIDAKYSEEKNLIVASGTAGLVYILTINGVKVSEFPNGNNEKCKFYSLANTVSNSLGISIIMVHDPEYKGERFWQHSIDIENETVGAPIAKWR